MPARNILAEIPGYVVRGSRKAEGRRTAVLNHPLITSDYEYAEEGALKRIAQDLEKAGFGGNLEASIRQDVLLYRYAHQYLTNPTRRAELEARASKAGPDTALTGVRLLMRHNMETYEELESAQEDHGKAPEAPRALLSTQPTTKPLSSFPDAEKVKKELGLIVRTGQAAFEALRLIASLEQELNNVAAESREKISHLESQLSESETEVARLRNERDSARAKSSQLAELVENMRKVISVGGQDMPLPPVVNGEPQVKTRILTPEDRFRMELPNKTGEWAGGMDVIPSKSFLKECVRQTAGLRKSVKKAVKHVAQYGPAHPGLASQPLKKDSYPAGTYVSRVTGGRWRLVWTRNSENLTLVSLCHHRDLYGSER